jgi:two-component system, cell cycle sensor histidine kinase and response regulator CckA
MDESGKRILVVDDESVPLTLVARMLTYAGYRVSTARSAGDALRLLGLEAPAFDLVVTDLLMPETDGRTLGRLIAERHPALPVIYMSGYGSTDDLHRGARDGDLSFLQKPFSSEELVATVQALVG